MATQRNGRISVGVRELHNRTSELMQAVDDGGVVEVTKHGRVIGRIEPVRPDALYERLKKAGMISEPTPRSRRKKLPPPIKLAPGVTVSDLVKEQRR